jgi:Ca-activated chloride channel homolog
MTLEFGTPSALWLLAAVPCLWLIGRGFRRGAGAAHIVARALLVTCLIAAIAQPVLSRAASRLAIVYLVDGSHSVSTAARDSAAAAIDEINVSVRPNESRILLFGRRVSSLSDTSELRRLSTPAASEEMDRRVAPDRTSLEQALAAARAELPPATTGRIVLFSDGRQTDCDALRIARRLGAEHVPIFTETMAVRDLGDTWVQEIRAPTPVVAGAVTRLEVVLGSQVATTADVTVREGARVLARRSVAVARGESSAPIDVSFDAPGPHLVEAAIDAEHDQLPENNVLSREVIVESRPRLLYVHADVATGTGSAAPAALVQAGIDVTVARPEELPKSAEGLSRWDAVVLSNIGAGQLSADAMKALSSWVEERGGGLLFVGGSAVFGGGIEPGKIGYRHTEIERVLPVTFDRDDEPDVGLVIVIDRSWSMHGAAMDLSKSAAEAAANTLAPGQLLGVLSFNNESTWDVPLARVRDSRPTLHDAIGKIVASGPTAIYPALEEAYMALASVRARAKHVVLLSDGQSDPEGFEGLVRKMSAAQMTVSSVALGPEADVTLLQNLATWGGGRNYVVQDARQIPEIFVKEARNASTPGSDEGGSLKPIVRAGLFENSLVNVPALQGRNVVTRKPQAAEWLATGRNDPLVTIWPAGLGRAAMFAADVDGRWTRDWLAWRGFGDFLSTLVRSVTSGRAVSSSLDVAAGELQGTERALNISLEARDAEGRRKNLLTPVVEVRKGSAEHAAITLTQVSPGRYEAHAVADTSAPLVFSVAGAPADAHLSRILVTDSVVEYRLAPPDQALLSSIAQLSGGLASPTPADIKRTRGSPGRVRQPLAPWLFALGLAIWPVDIALRRFRR